MRGWLIGRKSMETLRKHCYPELNKRQRRWVLWEKKTITWSNMRRAWHCHKNIEAHFAVEEAVERVFNDGPSPLDAMLHGCPQPFWHHIVRADEFLQSIRVFCVFERKLDRSCCSFQHLAFRGPLPVLLSRDKDDKTARANGRGVVTYGR